MLETWVPIAICAAFFQNLRSALQKHLKGKLSNSGAAYARFLYALPFAILYVYLLTSTGGKDLPAVHSTFIFYCFLGSIAQIVFTVLLLGMFSFHSFAVGTTFSKLEVVTVAIFGALILGDTLNGVAILAITISAAGVIALSSGQTGLNFNTLMQQTASKATLTGIICSLFLGASVVFFRGASLSLQHDDFIMAAAFTLMIALIMQTILMGVWIYIKEPGQLKKVIIEWRWAAIVGVAGMLASVAWFTAFTLQNASYVRALGQIELIFTYLFSTLIFKENVTRLETFGIVLVGLGILILLMYG